MANYINALERMDKITNKFGNASALEEGLTEFRHALKEMSESTEEAYAEGGEARALLVAMMPAAVMEVIRIYNRVLSSAQELNPDNIVLRGLEVLDRDDSGLQLAWIQGNLAGRVLSDVDKIVSELGIEIKKEGCFIATAVIGDEDHPDLRVLRNFRDRRLKTNSTGRLFIKFYYRFSPPIARLIARDVVLRRMTSRTLIRPLIAIVKRW